MLHPTPPRVLQAGSRVTFMTAAYQQIWTGGGRRRRWGDSRKGGGNGSKVERAGKEVRGEESESNIV